MRLPAIHGLIRRRLLINFRADPGVVQSLLPAPFTPKLHAGFAMVGICLIRLEQIRVRGIPRIFGMSSENAAHRIAVQWRDTDGEKEGVFIPRRDTNSRLSYYAGGRIFPGLHNFADFQVDDTAGKISFDMKSLDSEIAMHLQAQNANGFPGSSIFASLKDASKFFESGSLGYSPASDCCSLDGIVLETAGWRVQSLDVSSINSSYYEDETRFPPGSVTFDHALIMRDVQHRWIDGGRLPLAAAM